MRENENCSTLKGFFTAGIAIVAMAIAAAPAVHASPKPKKDAGNTPANVVAHVDLSGGTVSRMLLVKKNKREFLLLGLDSSSPVAILDVSNPTQPRSLDAAAGTAGASSAEVKVIDDTLAPFGASDAKMAASPEPKEIRGISGVTSYVRDKAHGVIYATNADGLWVVKTKQVAADEPYPDYMGSGA
jgi:hypothetical protein